MHTLQRRTPKAQASAGDWEGRSTHLTAWAVYLVAACCWPYAYGHSKGVGPHTGKRCWSLLASVWRSVASRLQPWSDCCELEPRRGTGSHTAWHSDYGSLFGVCGESKLIDSLSLGSPAQFRWKPQSCLGGQAGSCSLHHGDFGSWMVSVKMSSFTARVLVWCRNG